jgi:hypothetical protein
VANPPTGTVTFLFTDIEGSTKMWERHRPVMSEALAHHDEILRSLRMSSRMGSSSSRWQPLAIQSSCSLRWLGRSG